MARPTVSVIIPCYNQARFLPEAVASVRAQSYSHWECVIVNDGATDDTGAVARTLASSDERIRVVEQPNRGLSAARNTGLRTARGRFIQFLDADDLIEPAKLASQVAVLETAGAMALSYTDYRYCPEHDVSATTTRDTFPLPRFVTGRPLWDLVTRWETDFSIPSHCFLFDARFFTDTPVAFDEALPNHEDWDCWMQIFARDPVVCHVPQCLAVYRLHGHSMSTQTQRMWQGYDLALQKQLRLFADDRHMQRRLRNKRRQMRRIYADRSLDASRTRWQRWILSMYRRIVPVAIRVHVFGLTARRP